MYVFSEFYFSHKKEKTENEMKYNNSNGILYTLHILCCIEAAITREPHVGALSNNKI